MYVLFLKDVEIEYSGYKARQGDIEYIQNSQNTDAFFLLKNGQTVMSLSGDGGNSYLLCSDYNVLEYIRDTGQYAVMHRYCSDKSGIGELPMKMHNVSEWDI